MRLADLGVSYERVGAMLGFAKSTLRKWLKQEQYKRPKLSGEVLELDGVWMRASSENVELVELKVARRCVGVCGKLGRRGDPCARSGLVSSA